MTLLTLYKYSKVEFWNQMEVSLQIFWEGDWQIQVPRAIPVSGLRSEPWWCQGSKLRLQLLQLHAWINDQCLPSCPLSLSPTFQYVRSSFTVFHGVCINLHHQDVHKGSLQGGHPCPRLSSPALLNTAILQPWRKSPRGSDRQAL